MSRNEKFEDDESSRSKPPSRRNSASLSRRSSVKKEKEKKNLNSAPSSTHSTPKKIVKPQNLEFLVTGRQILKRSDRANSLPGYRRPSSESLSSGKTRRTVELKQRPETASSQSRETSLEDDLSLDLSQVSDFEDTNSKYGSKHKFLATSTPRTQGKTQPKNVQKPRSASLQNQMHFQKMENSKKNIRECQKRNKESSLSYSRDSLYKTSSSLSRYAATELDYSSVSPGYSGQSGQSSADLSPRVSLLNKESPRSQDLHVSSCCISSWQDCSEGNTQDFRTDGEWSNFWANYNNSLAKVPMKCYYDQCPTPYRTDNIDVADLDFSERSRKRSPDTKNINSIIRNEGLHLTPRETQNIIKCAHILGNVLTKAIDRRAKEKYDEKLVETTEDINQEIVENITNGTDKAVSNEDVDPVIEIKKKTLTLNLKETNVPEEVKEEKRCETVTTQTDISLPNTKSAPRIFEKILKQLSRTSLDVPENVDKNPPNTKEEEIKIDIK